MRFSCSCGGDDVQHPPAHSRAALRRAVLNPSDMCVLPTAVVAGTMFNIFLLIAALRMICRRCSSNQASEQGSQQQHHQARPDVERPRIKQPAPTVVLQPDNQVNPCFLLLSMYLLLRPGIRAGPSAAAAWPADASTSGEALRQAACSESGDAA